MDTIKVFLNEQTAKGTKQSTVTMYGQVLDRLNKFKQIEQINKTDLVQYFSEFKCTDGTRMLHSIIIKKFFKDTGRDEVAGWLKPKRPHETIKSDDILDAEDVNKMLEATDSLYWKALITILFETGARIGEVRSLKYKDFLEQIVKIEDKDVFAYQVNIPTHKTAAGFRKMLLINSAQYLKNLRNSINGKGEDIVFSIGYRYTCEVLRDIGRAAGLRKRTNAHSFRHARATAAINEHPEAIIRKMLGWSQNSTMISRYQHLNDNSVIESQLGHTGDKKPVKLNPAEKIDLIPVYNKLSDENAELKAEMKRIKDEQAAEIKRMKDEQARQWELITAAMAVNKYK